MTEASILAALYQKYIVPTMQPKDSFVGVELELPIVNRSRQPVDFTVVHALTAEFCERFGFVPSSRDDEGAVCAARHPETGDILSYDCSYNNLELSFGRERSLNAVHTRFSRYVRFLQAELNRSGHTLTGMGVNPHRRYNRNVPIENGRYRMLFHHLHSISRYAGAMKFHSFPEFGTFCAASQVQLDAPYERLVQILNVFNRLEPLKAVLFSNSLLLPEAEHLQCCRDMLWDHSVHALNPENIGMYDVEFHSPEGVLAYIASTSIYCVERGQKYINFPPMNIVRYLQSEAVEGEYYDGAGYRPVTIQPEPGDLAYLRTFKHVDLTYRGTVEFRSACAQPLSDAMCVAAFHLGLMQRLDALEALLDGDRSVFNRGVQPARLRSLFVEASLPAFVEPDALYELLDRVLALARDGLAARGQGEERFLAPLFSRAAQRTNPAQQLLQARSRGVPMEQMIEAYARL